MEQQQKARLGQVRNTVSINKDGYVEMGIYTGDNWKRSRINTGRTENDYGKDRATEIKVAYLLRYLSHKLLLFYRQRIRIHKLTKILKFCLVCLV